MSFLVVNLHYWGEENSLLFLIIHKMFVYKSHFMAARVIFVLLCILRFPQLCPHVAVCVCQCFRRWKALEMKSFITPPDWFWKYLFKHILLQLCRVCWWLFCIGKYLSPRFNGIYPSKFWKAIKLQNFKCW